MKNKNNFVSTEIFENKQIKIIVVETKILSLIDLPNSLFRHASIKI